MNSDLITRIRALFTTEDAKLLLINKIAGDYWYNINKAADIPSTGFCYLASEVYYHLNGKAKQWWFKEIVSDQLPFNGHHYFLQHKETGEIVDITQDQFKGLEVPYHLGKSKGIRFMSSNCSRFIKLLGL